ncbi:MAG: molybdopterin-binding protein, partial [Anaerolineae bacterium]|nr:molybdopterin-binding protein [Anaerolineae bacterium]
MPFLSAYIYQEINVLTACLLAIGNELLDGEIRDRNLYTLSRELTQLGFTIQYAMITRDIPEAISTSLHYLLSSFPDVIICSGGLGPTDDDLTLSAVAKVFDLPLIENGEAREMVNRQYNSLMEKGYLTQTGPELARTKMSTLPERASPLYN